VPDLGEATQGFSSTIHHSIIRLIRFPTLNKSAQFIFRVNSQSVTLKENRQLSEREVRHNNAQFTHATLCQLTPPDQTLARVRNRHLTAVEREGVLGPIESKKQMQLTILELQARQKSTPHI
jgi:hypothetical protein